MQTRRASAITTRVLSEKGGSKLMDVEPAPVSGPPPAPSSPDASLKSPPLAAVDAKMANAGPSARPTPSRPEAAQDGQQQAPDAAEELATAKAEAKAEAEAEADAEAGSSRKALRFGDQPAATESTESRECPWSAIVGATSDDADADAFVPDAQACCSFG